MPKQLTLTQYLRLQSSDFNLQSEHLKIMRRQRVLRTKRYNVTLKRNKLRNRIRRGLGYEKIDYDKV